MSQTQVNPTWKVILTPEQIEESVEKCAKVINEKFQGEKVVVACILKGAAYFYVDLTRKLTLPHNCYFVEASSYHNEQTQSDEIEILSLIKSEKFKGRKVILVDELYDNGNTINLVRDAISEKAEIPLEDIFTCTAFRKNKVTTQRLPDLCGCTVPDVWLVGYGLDDKQEKRNWTTLYGCPKCEGVPKTEDDKMFDVVN